MFSLSVLENKHEKISISILQAIKRHSKKLNDTILIFCSDDYEYLHDMDPDLLVISPEAHIKTNEALKANCILLPGGLLDSIGSVKTDYVISYGMSPRDTVTASSISESGVVISLQRELVTLKGEVLERQELPIMPSKKAKLEHMMAVKSALLLLGLSPEFIST